jgi:hypothetical protein
MKRAIERIRDLVREQKYLISFHANEEMSDDNLETVDGLESLQRIQSIVKYEHGKM